MTTSVRKLQNMSMKLILFVYFAIHNTVKAMLNESKDTFMAGDLSKS